MSGILRKTVRMILPALSAREDYHARGQTTENHGNFWPP
jgi:hypothetical protein